MKTEIDIEANRKIWDQWVSHHQDPLVSVERSPDPAQMAFMAGDIIQKLSLQNGDRFLDIGCGSGAVLNSLAARVQLQAVGTDFSPKQIENARRVFPAYQFQVADMQALPFESGSFDKVLNYGVILYASDWRKAVSEAMRVCRKGGKVLIGDIPCSHLKFQFFLTQLQRIPQMLRQISRIAYVFKYQRNACSWSWLDIKAMRQFAEEKGGSARVLEQPPNAQYGCKTHSYRRDLLIEIKG